MSRSPVSKVSYQPYPSTPVRRVNYNSGKDNSVELITPQRKPRRHGYHRANNPPAAMESSLSSISTLNPMAPASGDMENSSPTLPDSTLRTATPTIRTDTRLSLGCDVSRDVLLQKQNSNETYSVFIEAVFSDECAIYQLNHSLFVANGWNTQKSEAVRYFCAITILFLSFLSKDGIISRGLISASSRA